VDALRKGVDILVATPGRLLDLISQRLVQLNHVKALVLDEADRMLDMGFINDIRRIITLLPQQRQTILFSATLPQEIRSLMAKILNNPVYIELSPASNTADTVKHSMYFVDKLNKRDLLHHILEMDEVGRALVFTRTKHGADKLATALNKTGVRTEAIHGNKSQGQRQRALTDFKRRKLRVLVATDIAARGIDVDDLSHVINFDLPETPETYVHRIGRTGRAGAGGVALSFCGSDEMDLLKDIHRHLKKNIPVIDGHPFISKIAVRPAPAGESFKQNRERRFSRTKRRRNRYYAF
jgi:ATP-dependent RNA helicase RhlE